MEDKTGNMINSSGLKKGMVFTEDLYSLSGVLILNKDINITQKYIETINKFEKADGGEYQIFIKLN